MEKKLKVAIYIRVSDKEQVEKFGPELQERACRNFIEARSEHLELAEKHIYRDLDVSGATDWDERNGLSRLFESLTYSSEDNRPFDMVIVYKIDRFARKLKVLLEVVDQLKDYGIGFISANEAIDTSTPFGNAMLGILGVFAELERSTIQERMGDGQEVAKSQGSWQQDKYGYTREKDGRINRPIVKSMEADVIKDIFDRFIYQRLNTNQIAQKLRDKKVLIPAASSETKPRKPIKDKYFWNSKTISSILQDETYIGRFYYGKTITVRDGKGKKEKQQRLPKEQRKLSDISHTPIISETVFELAQKLLQENKGQKTTAEEPYVLSGLLKCDCCKAHRVNGMVSRVGTQTAGKKIYQCRGKHTDKSNYVCPTVPINKDELEYIVLYHIKKLFDKPEALAKMATNAQNSRKIIDQQSNVLRRLIDQNARRKQGLDHLRTLYIDGEVSRDVYESRRDRKLGEIEINEAKIKDLRQQQDHFVNIDGQIETLNRLKELLGKKIDAILQNPSQCKLLLKILIKEIIVYSKPLPKGIKLAGRKKEGQKRPYRIRIILRPPLELLDSFSKTPPFRPPYDQTDMGGGVILPTSWTKTPKDGEKSPPITDKVGLISKKMTSKGRFFVL